MMESQNVPPSDEIGRRRSFRRSKRGLLGLIVGLVILAILIAIVALVPVPIPYSGSFSSSSVLGSGGNTSESFPSGSLVSGTWSGSSSQPVALTITSDSGTHVFSGNGSTGSYSFTANGGSYRFSAVSPVPETVSVKGTVMETTLQYLRSL